LKGVRFDVHARIIESDIDARSRELQVDLIQAENNVNDFMNSSALHGQPQRFHVDLLKLQLNHEINRLMREQVFERERALNFLAVEAGALGDDEDPENTEILVGYSDSESEEEEPDELYCAACHSDRCCWTPCVDVEGIQQRVEDLHVEAARVRLLMEDGVQEVESFVALSSLRGGHHWFYPHELVAEMGREIQVLHERLRLNAMDKELHDVFADDKAYFTCASLHSYPILMSSSNAKRVLERERDFLLARSIVVDVIDGMIEWMAEGWLFGEPKPQLGNVPPEERVGLLLKPPARVLKDTANARINKDARKARGSVMEKLEPINDTALGRKLNQSLQEIIDDREELLDVTETTAQFAIFLMALMYFRSMTLLQREKESWGDENTRTKGGSREITKERKRMVLAEKNRRHRAIIMRKMVEIAVRGMVRKREREEAEMKTLKGRLRNKVARERARKVGAIEMQRVYRGYNGRVLARRWAQKKAEIEAMKRLMNSSCINIQRVARGFAARMAARDARMELAEFIAMVRAEEAIADEEDYWRTHQFKRLMRDFNKWLVKTQDHLGQRVNRASDLARMSASSANVAMGSLRRGSAVAEANRESDAIAEAKT